MSTRTIFAYILNNQEENKTPVVKMCRALSVSETGYYKWKRTRNKPRARQLLLVKIHKILDEHPNNENYGINRVLIALQQKGIKNLDQKSLELCEKETYFIRATEVQMDSPRLIKRLRGQIMY